MGNAKRIIAELGRDMGFEMRKGKLILYIGNTDHDKLRQDMQHIGNDMRAVMRTRP